MNTWSPRLSLRRPRRVPGFLLAVGIAVIFFIGKTARAEIVEVSITGHWTKKDFKVTDNKNEIYDPANPKFDGKVFGIAPSAGSVTVKLIVNTDGHIFYAKGSRPKVNSSDVNTLAHDFFGYTNVALVDDTFHFGSAVWRSDGNLTGLVGPNEAKMGLWTDADITKAHPTRVRFRMFGKAEGLMADLFVSSPNQASIRMQFLLWEYYRGEEIRSNKFTVKTEILRD